jgi:hypothetical protein
MTVQTQTWELKGGLDLESPALSIPSGSAIVAQNYEAAISGGYRRMDGYALFDGSPTPAVVSGSGGILGVWEYDDVVYAFRNNALATACVMHKATSSGWEVVDTPTLYPSGEYEFVNHNFLGSSSSEKMYGVDGKNQAFEFDGTTFTRIITGMEADTPTHVGVHKNHLFLSFSGGSVQHSGIGDPLSWALNTGAGELGIGTEITNMDSMRGNALVISGTQRVSILYGTSSLDWDLKSFSTELGVVPKTSEVIDSGLVWFNGRNITYLSTTQDYGDFNTASLSTKITSFLDGRAASVVGSSVNYSKNQYRLFFSDSSAVVATVVNNQLVGWTSWKLSDTPTTLSTKYMGCADGSVMELDSGTSFNGGDIESMLRLAFNNLRTPHKTKRFRKISMNLEAGSSATIKLLTDYSYGEVAGSTNSPLETSGSGAYWDTSDWDAFNWDGATVDSLNMSLSGSGTNLSTFIHHKSSVDSSFTLQSVTLNFSTRGLVR